MERKIINKRDGMIQKISVIELEERLEQLKESPNVGSQFWHKKYEEIKIALNSAKYGLVNTVVINGETVEVERDDSSLVINTQNYYETLKRYDETCNAGLYLKESLFVLNCYYDDILKELKTVISDHDTRTYESVDLAITSQQLSAALEQLKRQLEQTKVKFDELDTVLSQNNQYIRYLLNKKQQFADNKAHTVQDNWSQIKRINSNLHCFYDLKAKSEQLSDISTKCIHLVAKSWLLRDSVRGEISKELSRGMLSDSKNTNLNNYNQLANVIEQTVEILDEIEFVEKINDAAEGQKQFYKESLEIIENIQSQLRHNNHEHSKESRQHERIVHKNSVERDSYETIERE